MILKVKAGREGLHPSLNSLTPKVSTGVIGYVKGLHWG